MKHAASLVACSLALAATAVAAQPTPRMHDPGPPAAMTGKAVQVPLTFTYGMPTIEVTVNGKGPFHVGFDTGAMGGLHIAAAAAERVGLRPVGEALATDPSGKNPQHIPIFGEAQVGLGDRSFAAFATGAPQMQPGKLDTLDGIAGLGLFGGALVTIDYGRARLTVEPGSLPEPDGRTVFAYAGPLPVLKVSLEGRAIEAHLDTGNIRAPVIVTSDFADGLAGKAAATPAGVAHTVSSAIPMFAVKLNGAPTIGDLPLPVTEAQYPSIAPIGNVGSLALQGLIVRVDTLHRRVQVVAPPKAGRDS